MDFLYKISYKQKKSYLCTPKRAFLIAFTRHDANLFFQDLASPIQTNG